MSSIYIEAVLLVLWSGETLETIHTKMFFRFGLYFIVHKPVGGLNEHIMTADTLFRNFDDQEEVHAFFILLFRNVNRISFPR